MHREWRVIGRNVGHLADLSPPWSLWFVELLSDSLDRVEGVMGLLSRAVDLDRLVVDRVGLEVPSSVALDAVDNPLVECRWGPAAAAFPYQDVVVRVLP